MITIKEKTSATFNGYDINMVLEVGNMITYLRQVFDDVKNDSSATMLTVEREHINNVLDELELLYHEYLY